MEVEKEFPRFAHTFHDAIEASRDIFSPLGVDLVKTARSPEDHDDTLDSVDMPTVVEVALGPDIEDAITEDSPSGDHDPCFKLDGKQIYKARFLNHAFMHFRKTGSTDRLKRVANIQRYAMKPTTTFGGVLDYDPMSSGYQIQMDSPIASLVRCDGSVFLCIGEVNDIVVDSQHTEQVNVNILIEPTVSISYQLLYLVSSREGDDPDLRHDWQWSGRRGTTHRVSSRLIQPVNPSIAVDEEGKPFYLFESHFLLTVGATILEQLESGQGNLLPEIRKSDRFPYREETSHFFKTFP
jgi:hypothetical protein